MKFKVLASLTLITACYTAFAAWPPKNSLCEKARISELTIYNGNSSVEICTNTNTPSAESLTAINDLGEINAKASTLMGVPLSVLFPQGLSVEINAGYSGLNGSLKSRSNHITLSVYVNPYRLVNRGIYAHELGHAIVALNTNKIPESLKATKRSSMLGETIADSFAFALVGEETSHELNLPLCFSSKRIRYNQSYVNQVGFFDKYYEKHILLACCGTYANTSEDTKKICENILTDEAGEQIQLPTYNTSPFNYLDKVSVEEHRIGIPINSFLLSLGQQIEKDLFKEFIQSYSSVDPVMYECRFKDSLEENEKVNAPAWSLKTQLQMLRPNLKNEQKINFDVLWTELGLQAGAIMDDNEMASRASIAAEKIFIQTIRNSKEGYKNKRHCPDQFENAEHNGYPDNSCEIKCTRPSKF
jgi:hypothetical protein